MDISILSKPRPTVFESFNAILLHVYALHKERDDFDPPNDITDALDRLHDHLLGNG